MEKLSVLIVDDAAVVGLQLKRIIEGLPEVGVAVVATNSRDALAQFESLHPQVVFLDIGMPDMNGLELARLFSQKQADIHIIFATAYPEYALQAFELYSFDYMLKPFNETRILKTLHKIHEQTNQIASQKTRIPDHIKIEIEGRKYLLRVSDILYMESRKPKRVLIKTIHNTYLIRDNLNRLEQKLKREGFFRCHRSYLVNLKHMQQIKCLDYTYEIILDSGDRVMLSRQQEKKLREEIADVRITLPLYKTS